MAEEQKLQPTAQVEALPRTPGDAGQESQVTSQIPATRPAKNPKRVAAGKAVAERTRLARAAQKKAAAEASIIIANNNGKKSAPAPETEPKPAAADSKGLSTTQWISIIGIGVTIATTYVKREDLKAFFGKVWATAPAPAPAPVQEPAQYVPQEQPKKGIRPME